MHIVTATDKNNKNEKRCVVFEAPNVLNAYMKTHNGTIVAVESYDGLGITTYHKESYTLDNLGNQVCTPNGVERAYTLHKNNCVYSWGLIDVKKINKHKK